MAKYTWPTKAWTINYNMQTQNIVTVITVNHHPSQYIVTCCQYREASVNYSGNSSCDEHTYQPYMEHQ